MGKRINCLILTWLALVGTLPAQSNSTAAFKRLLSLEGEWTGTYTWNNDPDKSGKMEAHYYITGNRSALVEDLLQNGAAVMTSVYHMDGEDLRLTHFCAAQNQPRLRATTFSADNSQISFSFVDITNLSSPAAGHVQGLEFRALTQDHITLTFLFTSAGKVSAELVDLRRKN